jgi:ATP-dependent DNA ligase
MAAAGAADTVGVVDVVDVVGTMGVTTFEYPGEIVDGTFTFPLLSKPAAHGNRVWQIYVQLIKIASKPPDETNWDLLRVSALPIELSHLQKSKADSVPDGTVAMIWTVSGWEGKKVVRSVPTYFEQGKNIGKINETTKLSQAASAAYTKYKNKITEGYQPTGAARIGIQRYYPMAAHSVDQYPEKMVFPAFAQRKYDGDRVVAQLVNGEVDLYSRRLKPIVGFQEIRRDLAAAISQMVASGFDIATDGEFYKHGVPLQTINGIVRNEIKSEQLEYWIFDVIVKDNLEMPYRRRLELVNTLFKYIPAGSFVKQVETYPIINMADFQKLQKTFLKEGFEGAMYRNPDAPYETSTDGEKRSYYLLKLKPVYTDEFRVIGFTQGTRGRDTGALIWKMATTAQALPDGTMIPSKEFTSVPKDTTLEERKALFREVQKNFTDKYEGRMMTVEYRDLSKDGVPLRAKAIAFRDIGAT